MRLGHKLPAEVQKADKKIYDTITRPDHDPRVAQIAAIIPRDMTLRGFAVAPPPGLALVIGLTNLGHFFECEVRTRFEKRIASYVGST